MVKISPSILSADFSRLGEEMAAIQDGGAEWVHIDVMDGAFVPNISFGAPVYGCVRKHCALPFDVHLMINEPIRYLDDFVKAGADLITIHAESTDRVAETLTAIKERKIAAGLSIKPGTPVEAIREYLPLCDLVLVMSVEPGFGGQKFMPSAVDKIRALTALREELGLHYEIEVDGGINAETAPFCIEAGVDVLVAGSAVFGKADYKAAIDALRG
ncbi:MAG: ribulose-phosphate 3-epimerase [Clostridia bacterium]|nr:ribulose-phosphate 3-epimerase [Clostridia bacterium]